MPSTAGTFELSWIYMSATSGPIITKIEPARPLRRQGQCLQYFDFQWFANTTLLPDSFGWPSPYDIPIYTTLKTSSLLLDFGVNVLAQIVRRSPCPHSQWRRGYAEVTSHRLPSIYPPPVYGGLGVAYDRVINVPTASQVTPESLTPALSDRRHEKNTVLIAGISTSG